MKWTKVCGRAAIGWLFLSLIACGGDDARPPAAGGYGGDAGAGMAGSSGSSGTGGDAGGGGKGDATEPTYTVWIRGAVISAWDDHSLSWDGMVQLDPSEDDIIHFYETDYAGARDFVEANSVESGFGAPEVYGDALLSVGTHDEVALALTQRSSAPSTVVPTWNDAGWKHVPLVDSVRILIVLYDADDNGTELISYVMLDADDLRTASQTEGVHSLAVYERTNSRTLWVDLEVVAEEASQLGYAPAVTTAADGPGYAAQLVAPSEPTTLWVHGVDWSGNTPDVLPWGDAAYWTQDGVALTGPNPRAINYHARAYLDVSNAALVYAFDRYCAGTGECVIACHDLGCAQTGYALAKVDTDGTRWNVTRVIAGGSTAGGSELASMEPYVSRLGFVAQDLEVERMRALYDHDALGVPVDLIVGAGGGADSSALPGDDDGIVAYHSAGGARTALAYCNASGAGCDALPVNALDETTLYVGHRVVFRDDDATHDHTSVKQEIATWIDGLQP